MTKAYQSRQAFLAGIIVALSAQGVVAKIRNRNNKGNQHRKLQTLQVLGVDGSPPPEAFPLQACYGDCDNDNECDVGLICFQREQWEAVPGCEGGQADPSKTDYCIVDPNGPAPTDPTVVPTPAPIVKPSPPTDALTETPTEKPTLQPTATPSDVPTQLPTHGPLGKVEYVGNSGTFYAPYPLGPCKGDCDTDDDCAEGLYCHQRAEFGAVPYCTGGDEDSTTADYCAWGGTGVAPEPPASPPEGYFRLKIYWEEGYLWQNETFEREWCMMYNFDGYPGTGLCWFGDKDVWCDQDKVYVAKCVDDSRMWFTFVNVTNANSVAEYLIMTGDQRCFERRDREINLKKCDPRSTTQRWFALNGDFYGRKFEMSQIGYTHECITSDHHPKSGEVIETHFCEAARSNESQTSNWERY